VVLHEAGRIRALAAIALVAAVRVWWCAGEATEQMRSHTTRVSCTVLDIGQTQDDRSAFTCASDDGPMVAVSAQGTTPKVGTHVLVRGRIEPFDPPRNPGEPDERLIQRERGLDARLTGAKILRVLPSAPATLRIRIAEAHAWALAQLRLRLEEPYASILAGELWGERSSLPPELRSEFQETGTVHILVTAGLHLGVVAMLSMALLRLCTAPRVSACAITAMLIWSYALFSGLHLPSVRAATMITVGLCAYACGAAPRSWTAYLLAMAAIVVAWPQEFASASFALSFSCVGAILLLAREIEHHLSAIALPARVREALSLTIATQLGTWPLTASIFLLFSPYALLANLLVVPAVGFTMILGGVQLLLSFVPSFAQLAADLNAWLLAWIVATVHTVAQLPAATVPMSPPPGWCIALYDGALFASAWMWKRGGRTPALFVWLLATLLVAAPPAFPDQHLRITVLDVGQADCIVIQTPAGHTLLVDAGGRLERGVGSESTAEQVGQRIVVPFLRRAGVRRIDALILSHPHGDHAGGTPVVLRDFLVAEFADSGQRYGGYAYNDALQTAKAEHVPMVYPRAGAVWQTDDGVTLTFIGPSLPFIESNNTINDNSIAYILQYKHFRMLFTGDAGVAAEQRFLKEGIDLRADVLKVGHHGSAYSSSQAFIAAVHPKYAVISVGRHNMFGHPAPSTLETLRRFGVRILRTDKNGAATVVTDGHSVGISTML
jgi:competence protein ComEC